MSKIINLYSNVEREIEDWLISIGCWEVGISQDAKYHYLCACIELDESEYEILIRREKKGSSLSITIHCIAPELHKSYNFCFKLLDYFNLFESKTRFKLCLADQRLMAETYCEICQEPHRMKKEIEEIAKRSMRNLNSLFRSIERGTAGDIFINDPYYCYMSHLN